MSCRRARDKAHSEQADPVAEDRQGWTIAQLHAHYEQAMQWAAQQALATPITRIDHAALMRAVVQERLLVPDATRRTSGRQLARRFGCSTARVWKMERHLLDLVRKNIADQAGVSHEAETLVCHVTYPRDRMISPTPRPLLGALSGEKAPV